MAKTWLKTANLRWFTKLSDVVEVDERNGEIKSPFTHVNVLQQEIMSDTGESEWVDIPIVKEK